MKKSSINIHLLQLSHLFIILVVSLPTHAEITFDGTLGHAGTLQGPHFDIQAHFGQQQGNNLFHSFQNFNLNQNEIATFSGPFSIQNIISRVTGGETSYLDGTLQSTIPNADMYFLNPAGIVFGPNARLDVLGSLHLSTADYLRLGNTGQFHATNPQNSLLTVAPPAAFGFLNSPAKILIERSSFQIPTHKTLSLIGGDLTLEDSQIIVESGQVNLISVASSGEVILTLESIPENTFERLGTIIISDKATKEDNLTRKVANIDVSGAGGGTVYIQGEQIILDNGSVFADTQGQQDGQQIVIEARNELRLIEGASITTATVDKGNKKTGNAGNITVSAKRIMISDSSQIVATSHTTGTAGNITITAEENINISGYFSVDNKRSVNSGVLSNTYHTANSANITISAPILTMAEKAVIYDTTEGLGNAGNILIQVDTLVLKEGAQINTSAGNQRTFTGNGQGGTITIEAKESISISGRGTGFITNTFTEGHGGTLQITTPNIKIQDKGTIQAGTRGDGNAGHISLNVDTLLINARGFITTDTGGGKGKAGNIKINANQAVEIYENNPFSDGNISSSTFGEGETGEILITTPQLRLQNGGKISSFSRGKGQGGKITINAGEVQMMEGSIITSQSRSSGDAGSLFFLTNQLNMNDSTISTQADNAGGGNIDINNLGSLHLNHSEITARAEGLAQDDKGGNVTINNPDFFTMNTSRILASAIAGNGGNINITANHFLSSSDSVLDASSKLGIDGDIIINAPDIDLTGSLAILPKTFIDASQLLLKNCSNQANPNKNFFELLKRSGLPEVFLSGRGGKLKE
ncbi:Large exoprotein containing haemagglutination activity domain [Beggiatoa sp. PS]|nr:Large exoprotein containing haemagglutination activity domain [Beggiatoa sp. PS]